MKFIKFFLSILFALFFSLGISAQSDGGVKWRAFLKMTSASEGIVTLRCIVPQGVHVYGFEVPEGGPKATKIDFSSTDGVEFVGKESVKPAVEVVEDALFGMKIPQWSSTFEVVRKFRIKGSKKSDAQIGVVVNYMSCDNKNCRPPKTERFTLRIPE